MGRRLEIKKCSLGILIILVLGVAGCVGTQTTVPPVTTSVPTTTPAPTTTVPPETTPPEPVPTSALVNADWLNAYVNDDDIRILYVGSTAADKSNYDRGHIPNSYYLNIFRLMEDQYQENVGRMGIVASKQQLEEVAGELGITHATRVVIYGNPRNSWVARAFWTFKYMGHERTYYLDGGIVSWKSKYATTVDIPKDPSPTVYLADIKPELRATADYIAANLSNPEVVILDVRPVAEYIGGEVLAGVTRPGHIPGATNIDWINNLAPNGKFKSVSELENLYKSKGVTPDNEIITYCQSGVRSSNTFMVLKYILNYPNVRNYDGSWDEWSNMEDIEKYPVEK